MRGRCCGGRFGALDGADGAGGYGMDMRDGVGRAKGISQM